MDFPEIPRISIPLQQWRQVQPILGSDEDVYDPSTFEFQRLLRELQDPESGPCDLLQELWDQASFLIFQLAAPNTDTFPSSSDHKNINT